MQLPDLAPEVEQALSSFADVLSSALGDDLRSVILFGSAAEGRMRSTSDVNLLIVLRRFDRAKVDGIREAFRFSSSAVRIVPMFALESELPEAATAFAQKFADIKRRHTVLFGDDLLPRIDIPREAVIARLRQVLLNLLLRLRERYVAQSLRQEQASHVIAEAAGPLRASAASILELETGEVVPPRDALTRLAGEASVLAAISEAREEGIVANAAEQLFAVLSLTERLYERARRLT